MRRKRAPLEIFNLSFLDIISCGFGAMVLLVMISKTADNPYQADDAGLTAELLSQVSSEQTKLTQLSGELFKAQSELKKMQEAKKILEENKQKTKQTLTEQQQKTEKLSSDIAGLEMVNDSLKSAAQRTNSNVQKPDKEVGGIPIDSEYIIFIIDTSGSMDKFKSKLLEQIDNILTVHPVVKGFQVMNDNGHFLIKSQAYQWMKDTPTTRKTALKLLKNWHSISNSSPVEGLEVALKSFAKPGINLSIYIFGDDYTGGSYDSVINTLNTLNRNTILNTIKAKVHAIGFGFSKRFSTLMQEVTKQNGGTFIALP